jgi:hypothetical protein
MAMTKDTIKVIGYGKIEIHDAVTGDLIDSEHYTNVVTDFVADQVMQAFKGGSVAGIEVVSIGIGTDGTAATAADTALGNQVIREVPTSVIDYSTTEIGWRLFISASMGNGSTFREIGLFNDPSGGDLIARSTSFTPILKNSAITITFTHILSWS